MGGPFRPPVSLTTVLTPAVSSPKAIRFARLDFETALNRIMSSKTPRYASRYGSMRCYPSAKIPLKTDNPFPDKNPEGIDPSEEKEKKGKEGEEVLIRFGIVVPKNQTSKLATERNKIRTRYKDAVRRVLLESEEGSKLFTADKVYLANPTKNVYAAPMAELVKDVQSGLRFLSRIRTGPSEFEDKPTPTSKGATRPWTPNRFKGKSAAPR